MQKMSIDNTILESKKKEMIALREKYERNISQMTPEQKVKYEVSLKKLKVKLEASLSDYVTSYVKENIFLNEDVVMAFVALHGEEFGHKTSQLCIQQDWDGLDQYLYVMRESLLALSYNFLTSEQEKRAAAM